jgi:hypothetical protein
LAGRDRQVKALFLSLTVVEIHHVVGITPATILARNILGLADRPAVAFNALVLQAEVIVFAPLVISSLIFTLTRPIPRLKRAVPSDPEIRQGEILPTFRAPSHPRFSP